MDGNLKRLNDCPHSWNLQFIVFTYSVLVGVFSSLQPYDLGSVGSILLFVAEGLSKSLEVTQLISQGSKAGAHSQDSDRNPGSLC